MATQPLDPLRLLFVAERFNERRSTHWESYVYRPASYEGQDAHRGYERWLRISAHVGAFLLGAGRERLKSVGLDVDDGHSTSLNMLPPAPQEVPWDARKAREVAQYMTFEWPRRAEFDGWVLVGRRVGDAFGFKPASRYPIGSYVPACATFIVAHPSGLSRWWNEPCNVEVCRSEVEEWFTLLRWARKDKEDRAG